MDLSQIKVKLYGESFRIHSLKIEEDCFEQFQRTADLLKEPLGEAVLNISFFKKLNIKKYQSIQDIIDYSFGGLINNFKNKIEIWQGRRCVEKLNMNSLVNSDTLFPLYNINKTTTSFNTADRNVLIEKEVGLIGQFEVNRNDFKIDLLKFDVSEMSYLNATYQLLVAINYNSEKINLKRQDTLLTYRYCQLK